MRKYIFVDTETTGLDPHSDQLVELTYGTPNFVTTLYFGVETVPPFVDNMIKFTERGIAGRKSSQEEIDEYLQFCRDQTMVAANPSFDAAFLQANNLFPFHYRMLDLESYAAAILGLDYMPGMKDVYDIFKNEGIEISEPQHTSESDVRAMMRMYQLLRIM